MAKLAILFFAFLLFLFGCSTKMAINPPSPPPSIDMIYFSDEYLSGIPIEEKMIEKVEKVEIKEEKKVEEKLEEKQEESRIPVASLTQERTREPLSLPDITVSDLFLKHKRNLVATLTNIGSAPFPMESGELSLFVDGRLQKRYSLKELSDQIFLQPQQSISITTPFKLSGRHAVEARVDTSMELRELDKENNQFRRILEGLPIGPDIVIRDFHLTEDLELSILLANTGEVDLRKGVILRVRIYLNDRKISDFDHFVAEELKAHSGNFYMLSPPYRVSIRGISKVRVTLTPKLRSDDVRIENNTMERRFIIFPFQIGPQGKEQFSFFVTSSPKRDEDHPEKIKFEARWEESDIPLKLSFGGPNDARNLPDISGKSPLKVEWSIPNSESQQESHWRVSVTNSIENRVVGHLIIQHP